MQKRVLILRSIPRSRAEFYDGEGDDFEESKREGRERTLELIRGEIIVEASWKCILFTLFGFIRKFRIDKILVIRCTKVSMVE